VSARAVVARGGLALAAIVPLVFAGPARAEDEDVERARAALVAAVSKGEGAVAAALTEAQGLVGPGRVWPDLGAYADWVETLPPEVNALRTVKLRRAWAYVSTKRGQNAMPLLEALRAADPRDAVVLAYLGEATRLVGDPADAILAMKAAVAAGASDDLVVPTLRKIAYDAQQREPQPAEGETPTALPAWIGTGESVLAVRDLADVRLSLVRWAMAGGDADRGPRGARLREKAVSLAWPALLSPPEDRASLGLSLSRLAFDLAHARTTLPADAKGLPTRFDLLAQAVRLGDSAGGEGHEVPESLAMLAEEALQKGRYVLADRMARRRLAISDSAVARRVLLSLPPDAGE
jgi:hypothetical protein